MGRLDATGKANPTATDERYTTDRIVNNINISGPFIGKSNYNLALSYQTQERQFEEYIFNILQKGIEGYTIDELSQSSEILYSKGFVSNIFPKSKLFNLQSGYEFTNQSGFDAIASGAYSKDVVVNRLENYDFFSSLDFQLTKKNGNLPWAEVYHKFAIWKQTHLVIVHYL